MSHTPRYHSSVDWKCALHADRCSLCSGFLVTDYTETKLAVSEVGFIYLSNINTVLFVKATISFSEKICLFKYWLNSHLFIRIITKTETGA